MSRLAGIALRTPLVRLNVPDAPGGDLAQARKPAADRLFQDPRRRKRDGAHPARGNWRAASLTASAGNMAQGVAWCARERGIPCTVIAPDTAPAAKIVGDRAARRPSDQAPFERWWQTFQDRRVSRASRGRSSTPSTIRIVMAGNGTIGLEILEDLPDARSGRDSLGRRRTRLRDRSGDARVWRRAAASSRRSAKRVRRLRQRSPPGAPRTVDYRASFVDGIGSRRCFPQMLERARAANRWFARLDARRKLARRCGCMAERNHVIAEGAGACSVAAALSGRAGGGKVVCIVSGGNIDLDRLRKPARRRLPA